MFYDLDQNSGELIDTETPCGQFNLAKRRIENNSRYTETEL